MAYARAQFSFWILGMSKIQFAFLRFLDFERLDFGHPL